MYCGKCGAKNDDQGKFCIKCGAALEMNKDVGLDQEKKESECSLINKIRTNKKVWIILIPVFIIALIVIWILLDSQITDTSSSQATDEKFTSEQPSTEEMFTEEPSTEEHVEIPKGERTVLVSSKGFDRNTTEPVVLYYDGFKVMFLGIDYQDAQEPKIVIQIENQTNESVQLSQECVVINGYTLDGTLTCMVEPKEVQIERITLNASELEICEIDEIVELKLFLNIQSEGEKKGRLIGPVLIKNPDSQYVQKYDDTGVEIYRKNGIRVVAKILRSQDELSALVTLVQKDDVEIEVYIENNSENNCNISTVGDVIVTKMPREEVLIPEGEQGVQFKHEVIAGSKSKGIFKIEIETYKKYGKHATNPPHILRSMLEIIDIDTQEILDKTDYISILHMDYLPNASLSGIPYWQEVVLSDIEEINISMRERYSFSEDVEVEKYAVGDICGDHCLEFIVFTNNSLVFLSGIRDDIGWLKGNEVYDFAGQENFYCVYSPSDSVKQLLYTFKEDDETQYTQEIVLEGNIDNNEYYHISGARIKISKEEFDKLWEEYLKDGEKLQTASFGNTSVIDRWKAKYGVTDEMLNGGTNDKEDGYGEVMQRAITYLYNQDVAGYYSLLPKEYQDYVNNPTVVFNSTYQSTGVEGSPITKGEKLVLEYVREESEDVTWVNQIASSMGFTVAEQKNVTYKVSSESKPEISQNIVLTLVKVKEEWYVWFWF